MLVALSERVGGTNSELQPRLAGLSEVSAQEIDIDARRPMGGDHVVGPTAEQPLESVTRSRQARSVDRRNFCAQVAASYAKFTEWFEIVLFEFSFGKEYSRSDHEILQVTLHRDLTDAGQRKNAQS